MVNGTAHKKASQITISVTPTNKSRKVCTSRELDCWHNFTLVQTIEVVCLWAYDTIGLSFKFKINAVARPVTTVPVTTVTHHKKDTQPTPALKLKPRIYEIGPYVIRNTGQQQMLFNPEWSLKQVELQIQNNVSEIQPACSPFLRTSYEGWTTWLRKRTAATFQRRISRDLTGVLGTGLGVLNSIDSEIIMNKLATSAADLTKLRQPLRSSLLALGTHQWLVSKVLPDWERINIGDHKLIIDALGGLQSNISLALSCIQAQLWMQSVTASIIREGEEGIFPTEIRKIIWNNANDFEKKLQSWWNLVNFTYDPTTNTVTTFVLTICNASIYVIHPVVALGLNHDGTLLYPSEHRAWARKVKNEWQTVDLESCIVREQQGFICENNAISAQDICLDTDQKVCHFEVRPNADLKTILIYTGKGCVCLRTACTFISVGDTEVDTRNHSNFCVCNFTKITGCDFNYSAPVISHQIFKSNYTLIHELVPTSIGMDLTLTKKLLQHQGLIRILEEIKNNGQETLITVHHDVDKIKEVLKRVEKDGEHKWWDTLFGWSPTATGILNNLCHPIIVLLILSLISIVLSIVLYVLNWRMIKQMRHLIYAHQLRQQIEAGKNLIKNLERNGII
ncbi:uncharacterized protein LOC142074943 [Calonectris borealis]|uniref:uncharacterized protein LOC142074943 n=1 Tax=Calonectris borealis TaxID=1323832 RepID=UPI003F4B3E6A